MSRPIEYFPEEVAAQLNKYVDSTDDPYIGEFCLPKERPSKDTVYRLAKKSEILSDAIKRCNEKQRMRTLRAVERGEMNPTWAIFKMKQKAYGGWTDKVETVNTNLNHEMTEEEADRILKEAGYDEE